MTLAQSLSHLASSSWDQQQDNTLGFSESAHPEVDHNKMELSTGRLAF